MSLDYRVRKLDLLLKARPKEKFEKEIRRAARALVKEYRAADLGFGVSKKMTDGDIIVTALTDFEFTLEEGQYGRVLFDKLPGL